MGKGDARIGPAAVFVAFVWAAMLVAALSLVRTYGARSFPQYDELSALYDSGIGIHADWLWKPWAEHRIPLAKLIWKGVLEITDYDFTAGNYFTVAALAGVAFSMIWAARRFRGRTILADAFFPLALLNFGQAQIFLWWWQVNHILAPIIVNLLIVVFLLRGNDLRPAQAAAIAGLLIVLALCGPGGLPYVLSVAVWLALWIVIKRRSFDAPGRKQCWAAVALAGAAVTLVVLYFVHYTPYFPANNPTSRSSWPPSPGPLATIAAFFEILALSLGTATKPYAVACGALMFALGIATAAALIRSSLQGPRSHWRDLGFIAVLGAAPGLVAVIAHSRAGMGLDYIYQGHYLALLTPALCCTYFVWEIRGGFAARAMQLGLAIALAALLPMNLINAVDAGRNLRRETMAFENDIRRGAPAFVLAERYFASDILPQPQKLAQILTTEKQAGIGIFREIRDDPPFQIDQVPLEAAELDGIVVNGDMASFSPSNDGMHSLTFNLRRPSRVYAVRLRYTYAKSSSAWPTLRVYWRDSARQHFNESSSFASTVPGPNQPTWAVVDGVIRTDARLRMERTLTVWINGTVDQFRIYPDSAPCELRLGSMEILRP